VDVENEAETLQEISFREKISAEFQNRGFKQEKVKLAWMEFKLPKPKLAAEELLANNGKRIFYFSAAISVDSINSQIDVPRLISQVPLNESVDVINFGAWNNHPVVIETIKERIDEVL
jgi:hypothetical protein